MKKVFHKIMAFTMAIVVLTSTMSFTIDMHYCGDTLVNTAIFKKAKTCGMKMAKTTSSECSFIKKSCCSDKQIIVEGQDELKVSLDPLNIDQVLFISTFVYSYIQLFETSNTDHEVFLGYPPPLIVKQLYKLDETYLI